MTKLRRRFRVQKANPTPGDVHVNVPLTNISVAYILDQGSFIADKAFPVVPVAQQSNLYYLYNKSDFLRDEAAPRAPATQSAGSGFNVTTASYACLVEAFHKDIDDQLRANADSVLSLDRSATEFVTQKLLIRRELKWINTFFKTGVWTTDITPGVLWSAANATPGADVEAGKQAILTQTGFLPNTLVLPYAVFSVLRRCAEIRDQFKYTSADSIDEAMIARFFDIDRVLIMKGVYESAAEGATSAMAAMGGKNALLCYSAPSPSLMTPTAGYTFAWTGFTGGTDGWRIKRIRAELEGADRIEGEHALDMKVVAAQMGYFFSGVIA
jgi:hypothetical protein